MDLESLCSLRPALDRFVRRFEGCIKMQATRAHLKTYVEGQLGDLPRKSVEPIALRAGVPPRSLQEFVSLHRWDAGALRDAMQQDLARRHAHPHAIGIIDETSFPKKGDKTPGVQRQHCGATGKRDNCVVTVHLGYVAGEFHALLDSALFLPQQTWHEDRARCKRAGIPPEIVYRPKWQLGLDLIRGALARGVRLEWLCADELYGRAAAFRLGVQDMGLRYVVERDGSSKRHGRSAFGPARKASWATSSGCSSSRTCSTARPSCFCPTRPRTRRPIRCSRSPFHGGTSNACSRRGRARSASSTSRAAPTRA